MRSRANADEYSSESLHDECEPSRKVYQQRRETAELVSKDEIAPIATQSRRDQAR